MKLVILTGALREVAPTSTTLLSVNVKPFRQMTLEVENQDGSQTLDVTIWRRCSVDGEFSQSQLDLLSGMAPGESRCVDLDVSGTLDLEIRGVASGLGLTCRIAGTLVEV